MKNILTFEKYSKNYDKDCDCGENELNEFGECSSCGDKLEESKSSKKSKKTFTYKKSGLVNPKKADLNGDGKISEYELKRGRAIEKGIVKNYKKSK